MSEVWEVEAESENDARITYDLEGKHISTSIDSKEVDVDEE